MAKKSSKKPQKAKEKVGRPTKYDPIVCKRAYKLCLLGSTDKQLSELLEISESTLNLWKIEHPEFSECLRRGRKEADASVAHSLLKRAKGFRFVEETREGGILTKTVKKFIPPDTGAATFWLKNRQSDNWRDKQEHEHKGKIDLEQITGMRIE